MDIFISCQSHHFLLGRIDKLFGVTIIHPASAFDFNKNDKITLKCNQINFGFTEGPIYIENLKTRIFEKVLCQKFPASAKFIV